MLTGCPRRISARSFKAGRIRNSSRRLPRGPASFWRSRRQRSRANIPSSSAAGAPSASRLRTCSSMPAPRSPSVTREHGTFRKSRVRLTSSLSRRVGRAASEGSISATDRSLLTRGSASSTENCSGDVDTQSLEPLDVRVTPVPGGVGPLTSVLILENLQQLIEVAAEGNQASH